MTQKRNRNILVVCQHFWPESFRINDVCDFMIDRGCEVDVLCGIPNYPGGRFFDGYSFFRNRKQQHRGVNICRTFEIPRGNNTNLRIFLNYVSFPLASLFHVPRLLTKKYDKILLYQLSPVMMSITGIIVGKIKRTETTMYVLDLWPENLFSVLNIKNKFLRKLVTNMSHWHYRNVDKLVVLSEKMKTRLVDVTGIDKGKIIVLPQACEKIYEEDVADRRLQKRFKNGFNIVFTGNMSPAQSFETMIGAAKILKEKEAGKINWVIVGDGMSRKDIEQHVANAGLNDCFYFEGVKPISDIPKYTNIADVLVGCLVKSDLLEATIPAKVLSYFAAGKPLVLAMDGEVNELVNSIARAGFAGSTEDAQALANNIQKIYNLSPTARKKMGARVKKYHFDHFERNFVLKKLYKFMFD